MGNIQGGENKPTKGGKVKNLMKMRGKKGAKEEAQFVSVVPESEHDERISVIEEKEKDSPKLEDNRKTIVTDSWCKVNKVNDENKYKIVSPGGESSSDSVFTDPQTPVGFSAEINECYYSEESVNKNTDTHSDSNTLTSEHYTHNLTLNNFKLNEYQLRKENELKKKLGKLGMSKTSQISLDADAKDNFVSGNVEVVNKDIFSDNFGNSLTKSCSSNQAIDEFHGTFSNQK